MLLLTLKKIQRNLLTKFQKQEENLGRGWIEDQQNNSISISI